MRRKVELTVSKSRLDKAGKRIRKGEETDEDISAVENWRAAHTYILNAFQATLRRRARNKKIIVAERLKRRATIFDKILRQPTMALSKMQDIAGCRLIFKNRFHMQGFVQQLGRARFQHRRVDNDRFNYVKNPKEDGYRGVHQVYEFCSRDSEAGAWDGLCIEIQFRTVYQHAWATAVEIAGLLGVGEHKFGRSSAQVSNYFRIVSEVIARSFEGQNSCLKNLTDAELLEAYRQSEKETNMLERLSGLNFAVQRLSNKRNVILSLSPENSLTIYAFSDDEEALEKYFDLERSNAEGSDIVLVRAATMKLIRNAYRNYFGDASGFTNYVERGVRRLERRLLRARGKKKTLSV